MGDSAGTRRGSTASSIAAVDVLRQVESWPPETGVVGVLRDGEGVGSHGPSERIFRWASVTKLVTAFPGLVGVLPDIGRMDPNDWGLGFELRDAKSPHWTGARNSKRTFGHFGGSGSFLWVDPEPSLALACLCDLDFGPWALEAWPQLSDDVLAEDAGVA